MQTIDTEDFYMTEAEAELSLPGNPYLYEPCEDDLEEWFDVEDYTERAIPRTGGFDFIP